MDFGKWLQLKFIEWQSNQGGRKTVMQFGNYLGFPQQTIFHCWCGEVCWATSQPQGDYWRCSTLKRGHTHIRDDYALPTVLDKVETALRDSREIELPHPVDERPAIRREISDLRARRKRWMDLFETGSLSQNEIQERILTLDEKLNAKLEELNRHETRQADLSATMDRLSQISKHLDTFLRYLRDAEPQQVNAELHQLLHRVNVDKNKQITLDWFVY